MGKVLVDYRDYFDETIRRMCEDGLLLVTAGAEGEPNVMTIGWGVLGSVWGRAMFVVLVWPSRYSYSRLEEVDEFTVNVPPEELAKAAAYCGTVSGREHDKFKEAKLTILPGKKVSVPIIKECVVHYECRMAGKSDIVPEMLTQQVIKDAYSQGDFHRVYFGEILAVYADEDAGRRLKVQQ